MILLIDNYDSFSYNLYQLIGKIDSDIKIIRNDELSVEEIINLRPKAGLYFFSIERASNTPLTTRKGSVKFFISKYRRSLPDDIDLKVIFSF